MVDFSKYPRTQRFLSEHPGMTIDEAITYFENLENKEKGQDGKRAT